MNSIFFWFLKLKKEQLSIAEKVDEMYLIVSYKGYFLKKLKYSKQATNSIFGRISFSGKGGMDRVSGWGRTFGPAILPVPDAFPTFPPGTRACHKSIFSVVVIDWGGVKESVDPGRGKAN